MIAVFLDAGPLPGFVCRKQRDLQSRPGLRTDHPQAPGCMLVPLGVQAASAIKCCSSAGSTGVGRKARRARREVMACSAAWVGVIG